MKVGFYSFDGRRAGWACFAESARLIWPRRGSRLQPYFVVHRLPQPLFAPKVSLCRFHRFVAKQELDLLQFAARRMT
jgi:hypothetical protein